MKAVFLLFCLFLASCHPFIAFRPPPLNPLNKKSELVPEMPGQIEIVLDQYGIPYIKAQSIKEAMYGLGYMHARDRLFQLDMIRHAALGKVSELFGSKTLDLDRQLRVLSYRLDEQVEKLSLEDRLFIDVYIQGVNDGAKARGRSAEHFLLGTHFAPLSLREVVAMARLQSWQLAGDFRAELVRLALARANIDVAIKKEFLSPVDDHDAAILPSLSKGTQLKDWPLPAYLLSKAKHTTKNIVANDFIGGASNAWAVGKNKVIEGVAVLMNDPHLRHNWPSNFYMAAIYAPDFVAAGATFVGLPAILIGSSNHVSWGVTASYLDAQDAVLLKMVKSESHSYEVDGKKYELVEWPERFCTDKKGTCQEQKFFSSIFGPVIEKNAEGELFSLMWTGFLVDEHKNICRSFVELNQAKNVQDAVNAAKSMTLPGVNMLFADVDGNIAYSYAGIIPKKDQSQHPFLPLDGASKNSLWSQVILKEEEPSIINPAAGYLINANQNIISASSDNKEAFGMQGTAPFRALRIKERIEEGLLAHEGMISISELASMQLDAASVMARELAPFLGHKCLELAKGTAQSRFANAIIGFDGKYNTDSTGALPFEVLLKKLIKDLLKQIFADSTTVLEIEQISQLSFVVKNALIKEARGTKNALFDKANTNLASLMQKACPSSYEHIRKKYGTSLWQWRWGRHHFIKRASPLGVAPIVGQFFRDQKREVAGSTTSPLAESGLPVMNGANLRFIAQMSSPPILKMVIDAGNSGVVGHKNSLDQASLWHKGETIELSTKWPMVLQNGVSHLLLRIEK